MYSGEPDLFSFREPHELLSVSGRCCNLVRPIIYRTIFVQFLLIGMVLGLTLLNIFFFSTFYQAVGSILFVLTILLQTFPFCYNCNLLIDDSADLANAAFQSNWTEAEPRYKRALVTFIQHVQQPIVFIAGGIFPISMNSNISVSTREREIEREMEREGEYISVSFRWPSLHSASLP